MGLLVILLVTSIAAITTLDINPSLFSLLPDDDPTMVAMQELQQSENRMSLITLALKGPEEATTAFFRDLEAQFEGDERIRSLFYEMEERLAWRLGVAQLNEQELESIRMDLQGLLLMGPAFRPVLEPRLLGHLQETGRKAAEELPLFAGGELARMVLRPTGDPQDLSFCRGLMEDLDTALASLDPESRGVEIVWMGGPYRHTYEDYNGSVSDMKRTGLVAFLLIFGLLTLAFRDARVLLLVFLPLIFGALLTFGFAAVAVKELTTFTSFFGTVLLGLGIDFSIHLYSRYKEEREGGRGLEEAIIEAWNRAGPPCGAAAITTACGFAALMVAEFDGFSELGLLLSAGVLLCLASVLVVLPLLIRWREKSPPAPMRKPLPKLTGAVEIYRFAPLVLLFMALITGVGSLSLSQLETEYDISELRREGQAFRQMDPVVQALAQEAFAPVVVSYPDRDAADADYLRLSELVETGRFPGVKGVLGLQTLIPQDQAERIGLLREISAFTGHPNYPSLHPELRSWVDTLAEEEVTALGIADLPVGLQDLLGGESAGQVLMLLPKENVWDLRESSALLSSVTARVDAPAAGQYLVLGSLFEIIRRDSPAICLLALGLISACTLLHLRRLKQAFCVVLVLLAGMLWSGIAAAGFRVKLSIFNVVGISMLLGIGVDAVLHLFHRLREEGPGRVLHVLSTTGWAAALSATTTCLSFAALALAGQRGISSLGVLVLVGLSALTICSFILLPMGWMAAWQLKRGVADGSDQA